MEPTIALPRDADPNAILALDMTPEARDFFASALRALAASDVPFLVGGAYALAHHAGMRRRTRDLDVFVRRRDVGATLLVLERAGYPTCIAFPHWLAKAFAGSEHVDVIWSSGNGLAEVDDRWFEHAGHGEVFGVDVGLCPAEETIFAKSFIQERERYDGADVAHVLRARCEELDWPRLVARFGDHWRVLLSQLILFGFIYPAEQRRIPPWVMRELLARLEAEHAAPPEAGRLCRGTLLSRAQYLADVSEGWDDARLWPAGSMTSEEIARWTAAIDQPPPHP
ncbi:MULTISPECIES: nucleotidyltransferase family protein [Polyangium]|nr:MULTISPECIES: hypothetical protein [Polyangium]MDI1436554.1 hypothetical protein [Polyangium sorediatum]